MRQEKKKTCTMNHYNARKPYKPKIRSLDLNFESKVEEIEQNNPPKVLVDRKT